MLLVLLCGRALWAAVAMISNADVSELRRRYAGEQRETHTHAHSHCPHRKPKAVKWEWERKEGGRWITSFPPKGKSVWTTKVENHKIAAQAFSFLGTGLECFWRKWDTFSSAYLFQDGFSLWRLVSETAQEKLGELDCEVGEKGEVSYDIRRNTLWNEKAQIKDAATWMKKPESSG